MNAKIADIVFAHKNNFQKTEKTHTVHILYLEGHYCALWTNNNVFLCMYIW